MPMKAEHVTGAKKESGKGAIAPIRWNTDFWIRVKYLQKFTLATYTTSFEIYVLPKSFVYLSFAIATLHVEKTHRTSAGVQIKTKHTVAI